MIVPCNFFWFQAFRDERNSDEKIPPLSASSYFHSVVMTAFASLNYCKALKAPVLQCLRSRFNAHTGEFATGIHQRATKHTKNGDQHRIAFA